MNDIIDKIDGIFNKEEYLKNFSEDPEKIEVFVEKMMSIYNKKRVYFVKLLEDELCPECNSKMEITQGPDYSSRTKHTQIWLSCEKCKKGSYYYCFDENMNTCDLLPWEHEKD